MIRTSDPQATEPTEYPALRAVIVEKYPSLSPQHKEIAEFALFVNGGAKLVHPGGAKLVHLRAPRKIMRLT